MAQIAFSEAGAALGARFLPGGVSVFGRQFAGAQIGRTLGSLAGAAIDQAYFTPPLEGPRLRALHVMESREGAGLPNVYGRMRVGGQVIWAGDFTENRTSQGGKGGPRVSTYSYTVSFAVAVCEGPNARIERIWANGEPLSLGSYTHRIYPGSETQEPDPAIEAELGAGKAPAYRGTCYILFEDFPLEAFGNRLPQLSFEVVKTPAASDESTVRDVVKAVNIIPATGEFVYAAEPVRTRTFPGRETPLNVHSVDGRSDFLVSMDQLQAELPNVTAASLTVGWFGTDLRAGHCEIRPGVETQDRVTVPRSWQVCGEGREGAYLISQTEAGNANYGGTPADWCVIQAMQELAARGIAVTLTPFLLMDVPPGNTLPDLGGGTGQPAFPWRGRISSDLDGTAGARTAVADFMGAAQPSHFNFSDDIASYSGPGSDWGYRRFILHHAALAKASGACSAFLIGSEMRALTQLRDDTGAFPFVEALVTLAQDVKAMLGPGVEVGYAADWSEYGAFVPGDGSGDVLFPLDPLWAETSIDFVGIDWYPPAGDWRDGETHLDKLAGYDRPGDAAYILANQTGGENFEWYYASPADRDAQTRTLIDDTAHGEHWVFRAKDIAGWWGAAHHERPGGVRNASPTAWTASSKPVRFSEIGFPAVDKGINSPNLFYDPKSSESAVPPYSSGARDDVLQAEALIGALGYWDSVSFVDQAAVWAWDARPYPDFPVRSTVWSDGENWSYGHWLNGRTGLATLSAVLTDLGQRADVSLSPVGVTGLVQGFALDGVTRLKDALAPLTVGFGLACAETAGQLQVSAIGTEAGFCFSQELLVENGLERMRRTQIAPPGRLVLTYAGLENAFQTSTIEVRSSIGDIHRTASLALPLVLSEPQAAGIAARLLQAHQRVDRLAIDLGDLDAGFSLFSTVEVEGLGGLWTVLGEELTASRTLSLEPAPSGQVVSLATELPSVSGTSGFAAPADLLIIDAPLLPLEDAGARGLVLAGFADPWPGEVGVLSGNAADQLVEIARLSLPALTGILTRALQSGPVARWDHAANLEVEMAFPLLASATQDAVLAGANHLLVETQAGWELLAFAQVELLESANYRLTQLLRGLNGSEVATEAGAPVGARCVLVDAALLRLAKAASQPGLERVWQAGLSGEPQSVTFQDFAGLPWRPGHARWTSVTRVEWAERGPHIPDDWDAPDPERLYSYDVAWTPSGQSETEQTVAATGFDLPVGASNIRVRSRSSEGRTSDWLSIPGPND
ncbi:MAG: glycoside hydrolase/phage tail family protein [Hyphomonadaceae bacterium]|nr:glycoside hydrolase/phage tail family protein [Hyphomonadaceae bacterium]